MRRRSLLGDFPPGKFQAVVGVEGDHSGSNVDWGVRREEIVENSTRGMGGSGGKDGHLW